MKKKFRNIAHRTLSCLLCVLMLVQLIPASIFAVGEQEDMAFAGFENWELTEGSWELSKGITGNGAALIAEAGKDAVIQSDHLGVSAGEQLRAGIWVKMPQTLSANAYIAFYTDGEGTVSAGAPVLLATQKGTGEFTELASDVIVPQKAVSARLQLGITGAGTCVADNAYIRAYSDLPEFVGVMGDG